MYGPDEEPADAKVNRTSLSGWCPMCAVLLSLLSDTFLKLNELSLQFQLECVALAI